jgi:hypothetical protein
LREIAGLLGRLRNDLEGRDARLRLLSSQIEDLQGIVNRDRERVAKEMAIERMGHVERRAPPPIITVSRAGGSAGRPLGLASLFDDDIEWGRERVSQALWR